VHLIPWLDPAFLIDGFGAYALLGVCIIIFAETGLLIGFLFPGDTLLILTGVLAISGTFGVNIGIVCASIALAAFMGGEVGYWIGHKAGPRIFEKRESGLFSKKNVERTNAFFVRFGPIAVILARFVPVVRTFTPLAAGVGHMPWKRYTLYNFIGAAIWGAGLTYLGFLAGHIPGVKEFVEEYIDVVLIGVVLIVLVPTIFHYVQSFIRARRDRARNADGPLTDAEVTLPPEVFSPRNSDAKKS
jgi:membrane-associated protein